MLQNNNNKIKKLIKNKILNVEGSTGGKSPLKKKEKGVHCFQIHRKFKRINKIRGWGWGRNGRKNGATVNVREIETKHFQDEK